MPGILEKGGLKSTWENFKNRFSFGGQVITQQEIIFIRMQPVAGNKFGTQNAVEYFSERYQQLLNIRSMVYLISRFLIQSFSTLAQSVNRLKNINHLHSKILLKELFDKISLLKLLSQFPNSLMSTELISIA